MTKLSEKLAAAKQCILNAGAGKSRSHVEKICQVLREIFPRARKSQLITYDPSENLELPEAKDGTHRSLTDAERKVLLKAQRTCISLPCCIPGCAWVRRRRSIGQMWPLNTKRSISCRPTTLPAGWPQRKSWWK